MCLGKPFWGARFVYRERLGHSRLSHVKSCEWTRQRSCRQQRGGRGTDDDRRPEAYGGRCRVDFPNYAASGHLAKDTSPVYKAKDLGIGGQRAVFLYVTKREILFSECNKRGVIVYQLSEYRQNGGPSRNRGHSAVSSHGRRGFKVGDDLRKLQARSSAATWHRPNREFIVLIHHFCTALLSHSLSYHRRPDLALITTISY